MTKKLIIQNDEYFKFKKILKSSNDDRSLAIEGLKNVEISLIRKIMLGKILNRYERHAYIEQNKDIEKYMLPWNDLFKEFKKLKPDASEKELIKEEFSKEFIPILKQHHEFIKSVKIDLSW